MIDTGPHLRLIIGDNEPTYTPSQFQFLRDVRANRVTYSTRTSKMMVSRGRHPRKGVWQPLWALLKVEELQWLPRHFAVSLTAQGDNVLDALEKQ